MKKDIPGGKNLVFNLKKTGIGLKITDAGVERISPGIKITGIGVTKPTFGVNQFI